MGIITLQMYRIFLFSNKRLKTHYIVFVLLFLREIKL